jgi:hypothetical protein
VVVMVMMVVAVVVIMAMIVVMRMAVIPVAQPLEGAGRLSLAIEQRLQH